MIMVQNQPDPRIPEALEDVMRNRWAHKPIQNANDMFGLGIHFLVLVCSCDRRNLQESQRMSLLEVMANVGVHLVKLLRGETGRTSRMFGLIASSLLVALMIVDCAALHAKYFAGDFDWNARRVFLVHNPTCLEVLLAENMPQT
jgi:hypothetical protein